MALDYPEQLQIDVFLRKQNQHKPKFAFPRLFLQPDMEFQHLLA